MGTKQKIGLILSSAIVFGGVGCATGPTSQDYKELENQVVELQKSQIHQSKLLEDLTTKVQVLKEQLARTQPQTMEAPVHSQAGVPNLTVTLKKLPGPPAPVAVVGRSSPSQSADEKIYEQAVADSRKPQLVALEHDVELLFKGYRESPLTSNVLYLYAETLFTRAMYAKSAEQFEKLYKLYPDGNKAVAALYELGLCYQKMGHPKEAQEAFQNIIAVYPGSREAVDAEKLVLNGGDSAE